jgi:hypothetical protein
VKDTLAPVVLLLGVTTGCVRPAQYEVATFTESTVETVVSAPSETREVVLADDEGVEGAPEAASAARSLAGVMPAAPRDPILFRLGAGYGALGQIDLAPCREQGLAPGYLHVRVTFRRSGRIVHAAVESPIAPPTEALECIGEQLEMAMVPGFDGDDVTLTRSFFVN